MKRILYFLLLLPSLFLHSEEKFPEVIDYAKFKGAFGTFEEQAWRLGVCAFNGAPELGPFFATLKRDYKIDAVVETGTFHGNSTVLFSLLFDEVHTIEVVQSTYDTTKELLSEFKNVTCYLGSSDIVLKELLPELKDKKILFYLDAHWHSNWPLLAELEAISATHYDNCIIVIDDFKVPDRGDIPYDKYGAHECSYEYIKTKLNQVYSDYSIHYLIPRLSAARAKFVAIPKNWKSE